VAERVGVEKAPESKTVRVSVAVTEIPVGSKMENSWEAMAVTTRVPRRRGVARRRAVMRREAPSRRAWSSMEASIRRQARARQMATRPHSHAARVKMQRRTSRGPAGSREISRRRRVCFHP